MISPYLETTGRNLSDVRLVNRAVIFRTIREAGGISRAALAKNTGLNPATITHIVRELIHQGLIEEAGNAESSGGRPSSILRIRTQAGYIISVQLDRLYIKAMITNLDLGEKIQEQVVTNSPQNPTDISLSVLLDLIQTLISRSKLNPRQILGIGICAPGPVDYHHGVLLSPPNFPGWPDTPLKQIIETRFNLPTFLDQDANACALAEKWFGATREFENFVYILGDGGLGGALYFAGDIQRGRNNIVGEIGHTTINLNGPTCPCGNIGCLELYASPHAVEEHIRTLIAEGKNSLLVNLVNGNLDLITFQAIIHAAQQDDPLCRFAIREMGNALAVGVVNLINTLDPEAVVIGGQIALTENLISDILLERVHQRSLTRRAEPTPILYTILKQDAPIVGAFSLVMRQLFQNPSFGYDTK